MKFFKKAKKIDALLGEEFMILYKRKIDGRRKLPYKISLKGLLKEVNSIVLNLSKKYHIMNYNLDGDNLTVVIYNK